MDYGYKKNIDGELENAEEVNKIVPANKHSRIIVNLLNLNCSIILFYNTKA